MGEELKVSNIKFYIGGEEIGNIKSGSVNFEVDKLSISDKDNVGCMNFSNREFTFTLIDKKLNKYHKLIIKSKSWRVKKKNKKKYEMEFKRKYGALLGLN